MYLPDMEQIYFLQSLGFAIGHSFWQAAILWFFYQFIALQDRKLSANIKYNISIVFIFFSFTWFIVTIFQTYCLLLNSQPVFTLYYFEGWVFNLKFINNALPYLSIAYLLVLCFYILSFYKNLSYHWRLVNISLKKAPIDIRLFTNKVAFQLGIKKKIQVWLSENVDVPSVTGFLKPIIFLPAAITNQLTIQQTEAILLHELAHIKRNDYLINLLQSAVEVVLFFNPFVTFLGKTAKKERENCCDDCVIDFQYDSFEYAKALISLEEQRQLMNENFAMTATNGKKNLLKRVKRLFNNQPYTGLSSYQKIKLATTGVILLLIIFISFIISGGQNVKNDSKILSNSPSTATEFVTKLPKENGQKAELISQPITKLNTTASEITKRRSKKRPTTQPENGYVDVFINKELLAPTEESEAFSTQVAEKKVEISTYFVTIEEQQSGKKQTSIYYFELQNHEGKTVIKPLIILNKSVSKPDTLALTTTNDTSQDASKKKVKRKRITS